MADRLRLTDGERLWLWRRRLGLTQSQAMLKFGCGRNYYSWMENGGRDVLRPRNPLHAEAMRALSPTPRELLQLYRRRSGLTLEEIGGRLGVCRVTALKWENQGDAALWELWRRRDYPLPPAVAAAL